MAIVDDWILSERPMIRIAVTAMWTALVVVVGLTCLVSFAEAHDVSEADAELIARSSGVQIPLYIRLGAKHMVTGFDHLLFLAGVLFYARSIRRVATLVTLFALGHSITLIGGVLLNLDVDPNLVDAIIGLSVAYKGFDNLGGFERVFGESPNELVAVIVFGLFHGLGLATKLQDLDLAADGSLANLVAFNVGVEAGQFAALVAILFMLQLIPTHDKNTLISRTVNGGLIVAGLALMAYQLSHSSFG